MHPHEACFLEPIGGTKANIDEVAHPNSEFDNKSDILFWGTQDQVLVPCNDAKENRLEYHGI